MKLRRGVLGAIVLVVSLTGAAGWSGRATSISGACALITRGEAASAVGAPVPAGTEKIWDFPLQGRTVKAEYCGFGSKVSVARFSLGSGAPALFGQYRQSLAGQDGYQNVKGVGDEAFAAKGQLSVRVGQTGLIIDVGQARGGGAKELRAEKGLAVKAVSRL